MKTGFPLDLYASAGVGIAALLLGLYLTRKIPFLKRFCIPAPVSGGLLVSLLTLFLGMAMASLRLWELASLALPLTLFLNLIR